MDWSMRIRQVDLTGWQQCDGDVYAYLRMKIQVRLCTRARKGVGQAGWCIIDALRSDPSSLRPCVIWADGISEGSQMSPRKSTGEGESWWPALIVAPTNGAQECVPMYCPALAWQGARPWWANVDRVWEFEEFGDDPIIEIIETPGVFVEELTSESEPEGSYHTSDLTSEAESYVVIGEPETASSETSFVCVVPRWRRWREQREL